MTVERTIAVQFPYASGLTAKSLVLALLLCASGFAMPAAGSTNFVGESLVELKKGQAGIISYGLYCIISGSRAASNAPPGGNLVLILRNSGAKFVNVDDLTAEDFDLRDANGEKMKTYLKVKPHGIAYGEATLLNLTVDHSKNAQTPWSLHFKSKDTLASFEVSISDIIPHR